MTHERRRRRGIVITGVALALGATACGSGGTTGAQAKGTTKAQAKGTTNAVLTAYHRTVAARTAKLSLDETVSATGSGSGNHLSLKGTGSIDFSGKTAKVTISVPSGGSVQLRLITPNLYIKLPAQAQAQAQVPGNKPWIKVNYDKVAQAQYGAGLSQLASASRSPTQSLSYLADVSSNGLTKVGAQAIRGVPTTHYKATIDLSKAAAGQGAATRAAVKSLEAQIHTSTFPVQIWVDHQGRVRQVSYNLDIPVPAKTSPITAGSGITATTSPAPGGHISIAETVDYYDFGSPVGVTAPPASQVFDVTSQATKTAKAPGPATTPTT